MNELAAWMRFGRDLLPPRAVLGDLHEEAYNHLWRFSVPADWGHRDSAQVVASLADVLPRYSEATLLSEIAAHHGAKAKTMLRSIARIPHVPCLEVTLPLSSQADIDYCVSAYATFVRWPRLKAFAWACFKNTNPLVEGEDIQSFRAFYRADQRSLVFVVWLACASVPEGHEKSGVSVDELSRARTLADLQAL